MAVAPGPARGAEFLPCQAAERRARYPWLAEQRCLEAIQLVLGERTLSGADAAPEILRRLRRWRWLAAAFALPGMGWLAPRAYAWIARRRYRLWVCSPGTARNLSAARTGGGACRPLTRDPRRSPERRR